MVGLQAAQAISEPISQSQLDSKHGGGIAGNNQAVGGFEYINQLVQIPKQMLGGASHSTLDGHVQKIEKAPAGGHNVFIGGEAHYVPIDVPLTVRVGQDIEAGDVISEGTPNPSIITEHKGIGEGRKYFVSAMRKTLQNSGSKGNRRNIELLSRGLINHVQLTEETEDHVPDDIVPYSTIEHTYKPRADSVVSNPKQAVGKYLEKPVLHYTIGTKIRPSMLKDLEEFGVSDLNVNDKPPYFKPHMVRGLYNLQNDPDWMTQMYGSGLKGSLLDSTARGATSESAGTSFVSSLAGGENFGSTPGRAVIMPITPPKMPQIGSILTP
jgi:hypothetical protein